MWMRITIAQIALRKKRVQAGTPWRSAQAETRFRPTISPRTRAESNSLQLDSK